MSLCHKMFLSLLIIFAVLAPAISQDVDECALGLHNCHVDANCINTDGSYTCQCKDWFAGDGYDCRGFCNESCSGNRSCWEGVNGYTCFCQRSSCPSDDVPVIHSINLLWRTHNSLFFAWTVSNTYSVSARIPGAPYVFTGTTQGGFIYLGPDTEYVMTLTARNFHSKTEQSTTVKTLPAPIYAAVPPVNTSSCDNCGHNSHCNITEGGFTCTCDECYVGDGFTCTQHCGGSECFSVGDCYGDHSFYRLNLTAPPVISNLRSTWIGSSGLSFAWDSENVVFSNAFLSGDDTSYNQHIYKMAAFSFLMPSTTYNLSVIAYNAIGNSSSATITVQTKPLVDEPTNSPATTSDVCGSGFQLVGSDCIDIDECSEGTHNCHEEAVCTNTQGSFKCACNLGYFGNGTICVGICETSSYSLCGVGGYCGRNEYGSSCYCYSDCTEDPAVMITRQRTGPDYVSISWKRSNPSFIEYFYEVALYESGALVVSYPNLRIKEATFGNLKLETTYTVTIKPRFSSSDYSANYLFTTGLPTATVPDTTTSSSFATATTKQVDTTAELATTGQFLTSVPETTDEVPTTAGTMTTGQILTSVPGTTNEASTTAEPGDCDQYPTPREYREAFREWKKGFQKWQDCSSPCEP